MKYIIGLLAFLSSVYLTGCQTLGRLNCAHEQIAKFDQKQNKWMCAVDETANTVGTTRGTLWLNHHDLVVANWMGVTLDNNGTVLWVKPKAGASFPNNQMLSIFAPTISPGLHITGLRVCYGIVGDQVDTEVNRLRLVQYQAGGSSGGIWPRYTVKLEDTSTHLQAPNPPASGFSFDDGAGFICATSSQACLNPGEGTIAAGIGFRFGDADDYIGVMAVGLEYDKDCNPN